MTVIVTIGEFHKAPEWRIAVTLPSLDFCGVEFVIIVTRGSLDGEMLRIERLDDDAARFSTTASTSGYLCQECKSAFGGRIVGKVQCNIGSDDAHEGYPRQ